ncbi:fumarylacetoacetate hydrolase family protein [Phosphitispora fastidiosa]|uniref:fumarylacetoacetate hydrolase family protein n=1 Tax=Phosphitispora fastidiosa TaxID=2837202 RepID=UPI001E645517|nr:fumarylacetoacetate hydrolase family protein [Phosphitispora fastidiosa]MBU7006634.1 2-keto-4-pentenoate hydratase/2-oxohepta-3-ene-1 [Phosphitispora fastidiosa]
MKIVRFLFNGEARYGVLENDNVIREISGSIYDDLASGSDTFNLGAGMYNFDEVKLLAPCEPSKVVCVGLNYRAHIDEFKRDRAGVPEEPVLFIKPSTAIIGPGETIVYPSSSSQVDYEAELAVVIGKKCRHAEPEEVRDFILGYTCGNDVTARDLQRKDGQWTRGKGFDTFMPLGPWIETDYSGDSNRVRAYVNGELKQDSDTSKMIFPVPALVSFISHIMTLMPGDVVMTGTPEGVGPMEPGDIVEVVLEGIGCLKNRVEKYPEPLGTKG